MFSCNLVTGLQRSLNGRTAGVLKSTYFINRTASSLRGGNRRIVLKSNVSSHGKEFPLGKAFLAGASVVGMGGLCFYGMGLSKDLGAIDEIGLWPDYVRHRIQNTYMYFGSGIAITAASAYQCLKSPTIMRLTTKNSTMAMIAAMALMMGSGIVTQMIPYENTLAKHAAWITHAGIVGGVLAPICLIGGQLVMTAAMYTAGVVGSLSLLAVCAPSDKFLNMGGPLAMGLGVVFLSNIGAMFFPASRLGAGLYSISIYGGLVLFGLFLLYDTQKVMYRAKMHPTYGVRQFDPINSSLGIYMDTINIFIRIVSILAGSNRKR